MRRKAFVAGVVVLGVLLAAVAGLDRLERDPFGAPLALGGVGPEALGGPPGTEVRLSGSFDGDLRRARPMSSRPRPEFREERRAPTPGVTQPPTDAPGQEPSAVVASMPTATSFEGLPYNGAGTPPDTVGDVGPNHYVEAVNTMIGIYGKDGTQLASFTFDTLWQDENTTPCDGSSSGDPTVVYDPMGDRWIVADFAWADQTNDLPPYYECIAVSKTSDPVSGGWHLYTVLSTDAFPDYPKMAIWPDALYLTANMFKSSFSSSRIWAINRADIEAGVPSPRFQMRDLGRNYFSLLPVNLRGATPPTGSPAYLVAQDWGRYRFLVWKWAINWSTNTSTFSSPVAVSQTSYPWPGGAIVPQKDTAQKLDVLDPRLMMQAQYRNIFGVESIWVTHTVNTSPTGVQWAQLNVTGGTIRTAPAQQGIWTGAGDGKWRWIPSLAVDQNGNMAIGYSVSSGTMYPSIRYAGRLTSDASNTLGQGETELFAGLGSQIHLDRWGDYATMSVDPTDDCTFWFVGQYITDQLTYAGGDPTQPRYRWRTRIGSFRFPSCSTPETSDVSLVRSVLGGGSGTVTSNPIGLTCGAGCATYAAGTSVTLTAAPASGSVFVGWSGAVCDGSTSSACTFTTTLDDVSVTATFATTRKLTLKKVNGTYGTVTSSPTGIACGRTCSANYAYGTSVTLTATPASGRGFTSWSGCDSNPTPTTCVVSMTAARTVTATFRSTA